MAQVAYIEDMKEEIEGYAKGYGLDYFETFFEVLDYKQMTEVAAYGGFPVRYPHWRFGMAYDKLQKSHTYGLSQIYELVINNDPCYAYLLEGNNLVIQRLVMGHVLAHCDFFKNNAFFEHTNRKMIDEMANHSTRVRRYMERHGVEKVESFIDNCLSLENLIDPYSPYIKRHPSPTQEEDQAAAEAQEKKEQSPPVRSYMKSFLKRESQETSQAGDGDDPPPDVPMVPERDVLGFLLEKAPLKSWQRNVLEIVRDEAYYFAPQGMTKIMNEGWATYWHSRIMTEKALTDEHVIDYAEVTSGVTAASPTQLNPYRLGVALFRDIEARWNKGRFGKEWRECDDMEQKANWDRRLGLGMEKIFQVRRCYNDVTFIDEFFTEEFCRENKFFNFGYNDKKDQWEIESRRFREIKNRLLFLLTNSGQPFIYVADPNYKNRGELLLRHRFEGQGLKVDEARSTLESIHGLWSRPVSLQTQEEEKEVLLSFDGTTHSQKELT